MISHPPLSFDSFKNAPKTHLQASLVVMHRDTQHISPCKSPCGRVMRYRSIILYTWNSPR